VATLIDHIEDRNCHLPEDARAIFRVLVATLTSLEENIAVLDAEITRRSKEDPVARRVMMIPGVGPVSATAIAALSSPAETFRTGREFAAWLGLTSLQKSTGGKQWLDATSKMGERPIRRLVIIWASAVVRQGCMKSALAGSWLARVLARKPRMLVL
jgi:transposase